MATASYLPFLSICVFLWIVYAILFIQHHFRLSTKPKFQAVSLRIVVVIPLAATVAAGMSFSGNGLIGDFLISFIEAYVFLAFFGLLAGYGFQNGNVYDAILNCKSYPNKFCALKICSFGPRIHSGKKLLNTLWMYVFQLMIVKPLITLTKYLVEEYSGCTSTQQQYMWLVLGIISTLSVTLASIGIFRLYRCLNKYVDPNDPESFKGFLLEGLHPFRKFFVVKTLIFFMVVNNILVVSLIPKTLRVPEFICSDESLYCQNVYLNFLFCMECAVMIIPACIIFRADPTVKQIHSENEEPLNGNEDPNDSTINMNFLKFWDVWTSFLKPCLKMETKEANTFNPV